MRSHTAVGEVTAWQFLAERWRRDDIRAAVMYTGLLHNIGSANKAVVSLARHLAIDLWQMLCSKRAYQARL